MSHTKVPSDIIEDLQRWRNDLNRVPTPERILISDMTRVIPGLFRELYPMFIPRFLYKSRVLLASWKFRLYVVIYSSTVLQCTIYFIPYTL